MKTLFKPLILLALAAVTFTSCMNNDDTDHEADYLEEERKIDSLLATEKDDIEDFIAMNPSETPEGWQEDTVTVQLPRLGKTPKRGIWFEVLNEPTEDDDDAYKYELSEGGQGYKAPKVNVTYTAWLLDGTEVQSEVEGDFDFQTLATGNNNIYNQVWFNSFFPYSIRYNGQDVLVRGLTANGLKKGSKIRVISPSIWAFGNQNNDDIPANSPLVYEFEVFSITE